MADQLVGAARAALGQGLGMGWGDEAEAWLRSRIGQGSYEDLLKRIRSEYGEYAEQSPVTSGLMEFAGGVAPGVAAMMIPGAQPLGIARGASVLSRLASSPMARSVAAGTAAGAVTGAGTAVEGERGSGAGGGAALGGVLGAGAPLVLRGGKSGIDWLRERLLPTEGLAERKALGKMINAMAESGISPQDIQKRIAADRNLNVPSVVANVDPALADLAEAVAQRTGKGARKVEKGLGEQKFGSRERAYQKVVKGLNPDEYYAQEQDLLSTLRGNASTMYDQAYAVGDIDDPIINRVLSDPSFAKFFEKAKSIADKEALAAEVSGGDPSKFRLKEIYEPIYKNDPATGLPVLSGFNIKELPDVRTLDYIKRGIDATIDSGFRGEGISSAEANALKELRNKFRSRLDELVPEYKAARAQYAGDSEVLDALRAGMTDFKKMDHEQVIKLTSGMTPAEKDAFRTGVSRELYSKIMDPSGNFNAAQRIIGSPEMQAKLQPLFNNASEFKLFRAALEREAQLYQQANRILGGSQTGKRMQMRQELESGSDVGNVVAQTITGGWMNSLGSFAARAVQAGKMTEDVADKLADMLMAKDPDQVATAVKLLERYATEAPRRAKVGAAVEGGTATGLTTALPSAPQSEKAPADIEADLKGQDTFIEDLAGPDIEKDLAARRP